MSASFCICSWEIISEYRLGPLFPQVNNGNDPCKQVLEGNLYYFFAILGCEPTPYGYLATPIHSYMLTYQEHTRCFKKKPRINISIWTTAHLPLP